MKRLVYILTCLACIAGFAFTMHFIFYVVRFRG